MPPGRLSERQLAPTGNAGWSTIYDWLASGADLLKPLYQLMKQRVLSSKVIYTDDTKVTLIDPAMGETKTAELRSSVSRSVQAAATI
ncbi:MAG: hypothetical protein Fues2KO_34560 [Fuerstiella sp.]